MDYKYASNTFGSILAIISSIISIWGTNLQKWSHAENKDSFYDADKWCCYNPKRWLGFAMVSVGAIGDFLALYFFQILLS